MRNVKATVRRTNLEAIERWNTLIRKQTIANRKGWIERFRVALGMSITDLAERVGVSRPSMSKMEAREKEGAITIKQMEKVAEAMGGKFIYAIVPAQGNVGDIVLEQARKKAKRLVKRTRAHMSLEAQSEGLQSEEEAISELALELIGEMNRDFWK